MRTLLLTLLVACRSAPAPACAPSAPSTADSRVTFRGTSVRIDAPIELAHIEAVWDRHDMLQVSMTNDSLSVRLDLTFRIDKGTLPGATGQFHAIADNAGLQNRVCKLTGAVSSPTIPKRLTRDGEPFDVDLDVVIDHCDPDSVLGPLVLRGRVQLHLARGEPSEL